MERFEAATSDLLVKSVILTRKVTSHPTRKKQHTTHHTHNTQTHTLIEYSRALVDPEPSASIPWPPWAGWPPPNHMRGGPTAFTGFTWTLPAPTSPMGMGMGWAGCIWACMGMGMGWAGGPWIHPMGITAGWPYSAAGFMCCIWA